MNSICKSLIEMDEHPYFISRQYVTYLSAHVPLSQCSEITLENQVWVLDRKPLSF